MNHAEAKNCNMGILHHKTECTLDDKQKNYWLREKMQPKMYFVDSGRGISVHWWKCLGQTIWMHYIPLDSGGGECLSQ